MGGQWMKAPAKQPFAAGDNYFNHTHAQTYGLYCLLATTFICGIMRLVLIGSTANPSGFVRLLFLPLIAFSQLAFNICSPWLRTAIIWTVTTLGAWAESIGTWQSSQGLPVDEYARIWCVPADLGCTPPMLSLLSSHVPSLSPSRMAGLTPSAFTWCFR